MNQTHFPDGQLSQFIFDRRTTTWTSEYFGFTDPLTGTWKPKKFKASGTTVNDGRVFSSPGTLSNGMMNNLAKDAFDGQNYDSGSAFEDGSGDDGNLIF